MGVSPWPRALHLFRTMRRAALRPDFDVLGLNSLMASCERASEWPRALKIFETMRKPSVVSVNTAIRTMSDELSATFGLENKAVSECSYVPRLLGKGR